MTISEADVPTAGATTMRRTFLNPAYDIEREPLETRRTSQWFAKPYRRRISEYEALLLYAQAAPDWIPGALGMGAWQGKFAGGRGAWENYITEAKSSDWFVFRDPSGRGQPTYAAQKAEENAELGRVFEAYAENGMYRELDTEWAFDVLPVVYGAYAHILYGTFGALIGSPSRDVFTDVLRQAVITGAMDELDGAETIQAEKVLLSKNVEGFSAEVTPAREFFLSDPTYRTARATVERLWGHVYDPIEILFATYMVFKPLFGRFAGQQFFHRVAPWHGDHLTPAVVWSTMTGSEIDSKWALELFGHALGQDPKFGEHNHRLMQLWCRDWTAMAVEAMAEFAPLFARTGVLRERVDADDVENSARMVFADWTRRYTPAFGLEVDIDELAKTVRAGYTKGIA